MRCRQRSLRAFGQHAIEPVTAHHRHSTDQLLGIGVVGAVKDGLCLVKGHELTLEHHGGAVPASFAELEALPGVGHKTASVVMAQAFGVPAFPVDTHIHRLAQRWKLTNGKNVEQTEADLKKLFPREHWNALHLRIIFYGREYCSAHGCDGMVCEICRTVVPYRKRAVLTKK